MVVIIGATGFIGMYTTEAFFKKRAKMLLQQVEINFLEKN